MVGIVLERIRGNSYYCSGKLSIGVYLNYENKSAILIDSGIDKDTARKVDKHVNSLGYTTCAIVNTHSHADHCGGNNFFQKKYQNLKTYATEFEKSFIENPSLEPICFCGGAAPYQELKNKLLEAEPSHVSNVIPYQDCTINIEDVMLDIITFPGHTPGMVGVMTPDKVLYCGDAIFGEETISKHGVLFYTDIEKAKESLHKIGNYQECEYILYHSGLIKDIHSLRDRHLAKIEETTEFIRETICNSPISLDDLTQAVLKRYHIPQNVIQYTLTQTCVRAYVSAMQKNDLVSLTIEDGLLKFTASEDIDVM